MIANDSFYASLHACTNNNQHGQSNKNQIITASDINVDQISATDMNANQMVSDAEISATDVNANQIVSDDMNVNQVVSNTEDASLHAHTDNYQHEQSNKNQINTASDINVDQISATNMNANQIVSNAEISATDVNTNQIVSDAEISATDTNMNQVLSDTEINQIVATETYNPESFDIFLKTVKNDYETCGPQLRTALEKLAERYNSAKSKSIPVLTSFLYNINRHVDPLVR
ncbi:9160_t:CDS:2, partial [Gigaspora rosea]